MRRKALATSETMSRGAWISWISVNRRPATSESSSETSHFSATLASTISFTSYARGLRLGLGVSEPIQVPPSAFLRSLSGTSRQAQWSACAWFPYLRYFGLRVPGFREPRSRESGCCSHARLSRQRTTSSFRVVDMDSCHIRLLKWATGIVLTPKIRRQVGILDIGPAVSESSGPPPASQSQAALESAWSSV